MILCSHDSDIDSVCLDQGPANFSHKEPGSNILSFRACGHRGDHPALLGGGGGEHHCVPKAFVHKNRWRVGLAQGLWLVDPDLY